MTKEARHRPEEATRDWIGRTRTARDRLTSQMISAWRATLGDMLAPMEVPLGLHWGLMPDIAGLSELGADGHPRLGLFLPDLGLPRRMWAGGDVAIHSPFVPGETVQRISTLTDIRNKMGSTGPLAFVTLHHVWTARGVARVSERQDIVYRAPPSGPAPIPVAAPDWSGAITRAVIPDPVLLFRYSALTFNSHRIHYDLPYATGIEGYDGLVVHGPLQAVWMLNLATSIAGMPRRFTYRGLTALTLGQNITVEALPEIEGIALRVRRGDGVVTMEGRTIR
jgi:3-methylfumaryl-CoA hydratase